LSEERATDQTQYYAGYVGIDTFIFFGDASDGAMQKAEVITRRIGRPILLNTVPLQYQVTHHIGSFQMDTQLVTQEKNPTHGFIKYKWKRQKRELGLPFEEKNFSRMVIEPQNKRNYIH
jgi:hypothetical protein